MNIEKLKQKYNQKLNRYYKGIKYIDNNPNEFDKYIGIILDIKEEIEMLLSKIMKIEKVNKKQILEGF